MPGLNPAVFRPNPRPAASTVLVCLSYCGGGTTGYRAWAPALDEDTELVLIRYPGRESRYGTPFARDWYALLDDVVGAVRTVTARRYVLFGHSMGARVAFEVVQRMARLGYRLPESLIVSGSDAPSMAASDRLRGPRMDHSDEELAGWAMDMGQIPAEVAQDPDLRQMIVELVRADLRVSSTYRFVPGTTAGIPVEMFYGEADEAPFDDVARRWNEVSPASFTATKLPGGHFYTPEIWGQLPTHFEALRGAGVR